MSAAPDILIRDLAAHGVRLSRRGDTLHIEAPRGILTDELKKTLTAHKPALLAVLSGSDLRARLVELAVSEGIDHALIQRLPDTDVDACAGHTDDFVRAYLRGLRDSDLRERGQRPEDESAPAVCARCGPVWLHPAVVAVAPMVEGWGQVLGCPWCFVSNRRGIPRPS